MARVSPVSGIEQHGGLLDREPSSICSICQRTSKSIASS
jgi:hypothetical protein